MQKQIAAEVMDGWRDRWMDDDILKDWCSWKWWSLLNLVALLPVCLLFCFPLHTELPWDRVSQEEFSVCMIGNIINMNVFLAHGAPISSVRGAGVPCTDALSSLQWPWDQVLAWRPLVRDISLSYPVFCHLWSCLVSKDIKREKKKKKETKKETNIDRTVFDTVKGNPGSNGPKRNKTNENKEKVKI